MQRVDRRQRHHVRVSATRYSCSRACRAPMTGWARCSASARIRAGAARSSRRSTRDRATACSTSRPAPEWWPRRWSAQGNCQVVALDQSEAMLGAARARLRATPRWRRTSASSPARQSGCRSPIESSTRCRSPICCATSTTARRRCASWRGWSSRAAGSRWSSSRFRQIQRCGALWRVYTRVGLPLLGRVVSQSWVDVGRFLGPNIEQLYANQPDLTQLWQRGGDRQRRRAPDELWRRAGDVGSAGWPATILSSSARRSTRSPAAAGATC